MKRLHEDSDANPQSMLPFSSSSRGQQCGPSHPSTSNEGGGAIVSGMQKLTINDARSYLKQVKDTFRDQREKYDLFVDVINDCKSRRIEPSVVVHRVKELFRGHPSLVLGFNMFWPKRFEITLEDGDGSAPALQNSKPELAVVINYMNKVKERDNSVYRSFLQIMHMYHKQQKSITEVSQEVAALLVNHKDLLDEFTSHFLPDTSASARTVEEFGGNSSETLLILEERREVEAGKGIDRYNANCRRCTPSYRLLPNDHPMSMASHRLNLDDEVLNDRWVSVTSGSGNHLFKHKQRNQYEESLFKCEDDRFELDMLLESFRSFAKRVEKLLSRINRKSGSRGGPLRIDGHFTAIDARCIERLYSNLARDVMDNMRKNPSIALPIILTRLRQKVEEWADSGSRFSCVWAGTYAENLYKSLEQRDYTLVSPGLVN